MTYRELCQVCSWKEKEKLEEWILIVKAPTDIRKVNFRKQVGLDPTASGRLWEVVMRLSVRFLASKELLYRVSRAGMVLSFYISTHLTGRKEVKGTLHTLFVCWTPIIVHLIDNIVRMKDLASMIMRVLIIHKKTVLLTTWIKEVIVKYHLLLWIRMRLVLLARSVITAWR